MNKTYAHLRIVSVITGSADVVPSVPFNESAEEEYTHKHQ